MKVVTVSEYECARKQSSKEKDVSLVLRAGRACVGGITQSPIAS